MFSPILHRPDSLCLKDNSVQQNEVRQVGGDLSILDLKRLVVVLNVASTQLTSYGSFEPGAEPVRSSL